jgi:hypothetical protein
LLLYGFVERHSLILRMKSKPNDNPPHGPLPRRATGVDHLGIQVEDRAELTEVYGRLKRAEGPVIEEGETTCCYAQSEKSWIEDQQGVEWETFLTTGESTVYGTDVITPKASTPCCTPNSAV